MRYTFLIIHFAICGLVLFTVINNAKIVSYLKSILFLLKVTLAIIWVILIYFINTYFKHDMSHYNP